jgi:uncharacterized SAM-binding protein YcdF (DUF218 family)
MPKRKKGKSRRWWLLLLVALPICAVLYIAVSIYCFPTLHKERRADAVIVLGAAVWGERVSPVFAERINHAIELYQSGKAGKIIFTGGKGESNEPAESIAAKDYAISHGVAARDILIETKSRSTYENLLYAKEVMAENGLKSTLVVSDPLHMKRSMRMAADLGLTAFPAPTPTTRYRSLSKQLDLLGHETYFYIVYLFQQVI